MAIPAAVDENLDHGEVGLVGVLVPALLRRPSEDVQREVRVRLGAEGRDGLGRGESGLEGLDPRLELLFDWGSGSRSGWDRMIGFWRWWGWSWGLAVVLSGRGREWVGD